MQNVHCMFSEALHEGSSILAHDVHTVARRVPATTEAKPVNDFFLVGLLLKVFIV